MSRPLLKWVIVASVLLVSSGFVVAAWMIFQGTQTSLEAERTNQAYLLVTDLVSVHVLRTGKWPTDWSDLHSTVPKRLGVWRWPEDATLVEKRVVVDFTLRLEDVCRMTPDTFSAIRQTTPNYGPELDAVRHVIEDCKKCIISRQETPTPPTKCPPTISKPDPKRIQNPTKPAP